MTDEITKKIVIQDREKGTKPDPILAGRFLLDVLKWKKEQLELEKAQDSVQDPERDQRIQQLAGFVELHR